MSSSKQHEADSSWVALAEIARPHGVRGELRLRVYNPDSDLLLEQPQVRLRLPSGEVRLETVQSARWANEAILMQLAGVPSRNEAEALRGALVEIPRTSFEPLEDDEFYAVDVIGRTALERTAQGERVEIGRVANFVSYPSVDVFVIELEGGSTLEVPCTEAFVEKVEAEALVLRDLAVLREVADAGKKKSASE